MPQPVTCPSCRLSPGKVTGPLPRGSGSQGACQGRLALLRGLFAAHCPRTARGSASHGNGRAARPRPSAVRPRRPAAGRPRLPRGRPRTRPLLSHLLWLPTHFFPPTDRLGIRLFKPRKPRVSWSGPVLTMNTGRSKPGTRRHGGKQRLTLLKSPFVVPGRKPNGFKWQTFLNHVTHQ